MIYLTSDTHFYHKNIIKYSQRPFNDVNEMNEMLIQNWNRMVQPDDEVWHLGDFVFCNYDKFKSLLHRLNGKINVVLGNHDQVIVSNQEELLSTGLLNSVQNYAELNYNGHFVILFHYGQRVWNKSHHGSIHCYGHSHGKLPPYGKSVDVGVDCKEITSEYRPVSIKELIKYMDGRELRQADMHPTKQE